MSATTRTVLCLAGFEKGAAFIREAKRLGCHTILLTATKLEQAGWPRDSIDEIYFMPDMYDLEAVTRGVSYLTRTRAIDRIVALDDFDVGTAAALREHLQLPGMDASTARRFRDKLAMRVAATHAGVLVPDFVGVLNYDRVREFFDRVPAPWLMKPRAQASSVGMTRLESADQFWPLVERLGDEQSEFLIERYVPGTVYHVDGLVAGGRVIFAEVHHYGHPPLDVMQGGGIFTSRTVRRTLPEVRTLRALARQVLRGLGLERGAFHLECIRGAEDGRFYFLEVGARVGGASIAEMVEGATGVNLWAAWARLEVEGDGDIQRPAARASYGGVINTLARQEYPDTSAYADPEIVYRLDMPHHVGLVVASPDPQRVASLLETYEQRFYADFHAALPPPERLAG